MFGSTKKGSEATFVSREAVFRGSLSLKGSLFIDGRVEGDVDVQGDISIGPNGVVEGDVRSDRLTVAGRVEGNVRIMGLLRIQKGGAVRDSVRYGSLEVEKGGSLLGHSGTMEEGDEPLPSKALPPPLARSEDHEYDEPEDPDDGDDYDGAGFHEGDAALGHA